jgi:hypothetical protein
VATHVHIVEPQWNPSVEEQAIARALRMGQTNSVKVFRYIMKNTVEEVRLEQTQVQLYNFELMLKANMSQRILCLQKKKRDLIKFTIDGNSENKGCGSLEVTGYHF